MHRMASANWNRCCRRPMKDWFEELSGAAQFVVAIGDCATWGSSPAIAPDPSEFVGLQFLKHAPGGSLGTAFTSKAGLPVINIPGCPARPDWVTQILVAVASGRAGDLTLDESSSAEDLFSSFAQTSCTRNMRFAYKVSATEFGPRKGCLFYDLGFPDRITQCPSNPVL